MLSKFEDVTIYLKWVEIADTASELLKIAPADWCLVGKALDLLVSKKGVVKIAFKSSLSRDQIFYNTKQMPVFLCDPLGFSVIGVQLR